MINSGVELRNAGMQSVSDNNIYWKERAMQEMRWLCSARISKKSPVYGETFTFEKLRPYLEESIGRQIPHYNLAGAICSDSLKKGYIHYTGKIVWTEDTQKHRRKCFEYAWGTEK